MRHFLFVEPTPSLGVDGCYHFVYVTTNLKNGKFYVGKHSTKRLSDGYYGSGLIIARAVKKYGVDTFSCRPVAFFETSDLAFEFEALMVDADLVSRKDCYNKKLGGDGGFDHINSDPKAKLRCVEKTRRTIASLPEEVRSEINRKKARSGELNGMFGRDRSGENNPRFGVTVQGTETAEKIRQRAVERYKTQTHPCKGRKLSESQVDDIKDRNSKEWKFLKDGVIHEFKNLEEFCRLHDLNPVCMSRVARGINKSHRGWINV